MMNTHRFHSQIQAVIVACTALVATAVPATVDARAPELRNVNVRGLEIGATTVLTIDGADLLPNPRVYLDGQSLDAAVDPQSTPTRLMLSVKLPDATVPGVGLLRLATADGFSNSVPVGLDRLPQLPMADEVKSLPVAISGAVPGSGVSRTSFSGKSGDEVIVEVESRRLGSKLRPVLHVYDSRRVQVVWSMPSNSLSGDTRVTVKLPRDDRYTVELHDTQYAPPGASFFRLKIGRWQFADLVYPPAVTRGQESSLELLGNVAGRTPFRTANNSQLAFVGLPSASISSGPPPAVLVSSVPELVESRSTDEQPMNLPGVPVAVSGRLNAHDQKDRYVLPVTAGSKLVFEVFAERIGSRIDVAIELRNKQGGVLAANDDAPGTADSRLEFTVPAGLDAVDVLIRDSLDVARDDAIYRLSVTSADSPPRQFDLVLRSDVVNVPAGDLQVIEASVNRRGYDGPIQLQIADLPPGVAEHGTEIPAGASGALLGFVYLGDAAGHSVTRIQARTPDGSLSSTGRVESASDDRTPTWLRDRVAIAAAAKAGPPFQVAWVNENAFPQLVLASKPAATVKLVRPASTFGPVRLSLVTSKPGPKVNGQPNPNLAVRAEKPVELPVDAAVKSAADALAAIDKQLAEAVKQAQAAQADAKAAAEAMVRDLTQKKAAAESALRDAESKANYQTDFAIVVPSVVTDSTCDISVRAELLNPERNIVVRTVYAPIRRLPLLNPLVITLAVPSPIETTLDPKAGATVQLAAKIERFAGYKGDVTVTVAGLPPGVTGANATVKADQADFQIELKVPANFAASEITGIKFTATGPLDPLSGNVPVKSSEVEVRIKLNKPNQ